MVNFCDGNQAFDIGFKLCAWSSTELGTSEIMLVMENSHVTMRSSAGRERNCEKFVAAILRSRLEIKRRSERILAAFECRDSIEEDEEGDDEVSSSYRVED